MYITLKERYNDRVCVPRSSIRMCVTLTACVYIMVASRESEIIESSAVRIKRYTPTFLLAGRMRSCTLIFVALATILLYTKYINATEICPQENCVASYKCEIFMPAKNLYPSCNTESITCCNVVKEEYRTHCRHHGGECMENVCAETLQRETVDCTDGQVCCVLV